MTDYTEEGYEERLTHFRETRDPLLEGIHSEIVKIRRWVAFFGSIFLIAVVIAFIIFFTTFLTEIFRRSY